MRGHSAGRRDSMYSCIKMVWLHMVSSWLSTNSQGSKASSTNVIPLPRRAASWRCGDGGSCRARHGELSAMVQPSGCAWRMTTHDVTPTGGAQGTAGQNQAMCPGRTMRCMQKIKTKHEMKFDELYVVVHGRDSAPSKLRNRRAPQGRPVGRHCVCRGSKHLRRSSRTA